MPSLNVAFATSPLFWFLSVLGLLFVIYSVRAWLGWREVAQDAETEYAYRHERGMIPGDATADDFHRAFRRVHGPRAATWTAVGLLAILVMTPLYLGLANGFMQLVYRLSGKSEVYEPLFLVYQFGVFFLLLFFWAATALVAARQYHAGAVERVETLLAGDLSELRRSAWEDALQIAKVIGVLILVVAGIAVVFGKFGWIAGTIVGVGVFAFLGPMLAGRTR